MHPSAISLSLYLLLSVSLPLSRSLTLPLCLSFSLYLSLSIPSFYFPFFSVSISLSRLSLSLSIHLLPPLSPSLGDLIYLYLYLCYVNSWFDLSFWPFRVDQKKENQGKLLKLHLNLRNFSRQKNWNPYRFLTGFVANKFGLFLITTKNLLK